MKTPFNKFLYVAFLLIGIYESVFAKNDLIALISFGIGAGFDPFDYNQKWKDRPIWQKLIIILHVALIFAMLGFFNWKK